MDVRFVRVTSAIVAGFFIVNTVAFSATLSDGTPIPSLGSQIPVITNQPMGAGPHQTSAPGLSGQNMKRRTAGDMQNQEISNQEPLVADYVQPTPKNPFQKLVKQSLGHDLPMYGYSLFRNAPSTFAPVDHIPVTADYVIGPGDEILLKGWGQVDIDYRATVDRNGSIYIPKVGNISVAGVQYQNLQRYLKARIGRVFRNFDLSVSMGQLRSIQVMVVGEARRPGTYTVSSLSTLVSALFAAGGPSNQGSMRHIQLRRNNHLVVDFDLYDVLLRGDKSHDVRLLPGDVIYIQPIGPLAAVSGSVEVPAIYELKGKSSLEDLLKEAGGLATTASAQKVTIDRIVDHMFRQTVAVDINGPGRNEPVRDGDVIRVQPISQEFVNTVTLRGQVATPMRYPWHAGMRVKDLIPDLNALIVPGYWEKKNALVLTKQDKDRQDEYGNKLYRNGGDGNNQDPRGGELRQVGQGQNIPAASAMESAYNEGNRSTAGQDQLGSQMDVRNKPRSEQELHNEIKRNSAAINWDYAVIERLNPLDLTTSLIPFNLKRAIIDNDPTQNKLLEPGDVITIFSIDDIRVPEAKQTMYVRLEGEVVQPGIYQVQPGETLRQLVQKAGGLTSNAYLFGSVFTRESTRKMQQANMDKMVTKMEHDLRALQASKAQNALSADDATAQKAQIENGQALINNLKQAKATGRIVLELRPDSNGVNDLPNLALQDNDHFYIPAMPSTVSVLGDVYNDNAFIYRPSEGADHYLQLAGGPTPDADSGNIYIIRADGSVTSRRQSGWWNRNFSGDNVYPGDSIIVPEKLDRTSFIKNLKDWTQILYQFGLGIAGLKTLR